MPFALNNTAEILSSNIQRNSNKLKKLIEESSIPMLFLSEPLFTQKDVDETMKHVVGKDYNEKFKVTDNITVQFIPNGHLLGAASILVTIKSRKEDPIYLYFSGDYAKSNMFFDVPEISKEITQLPINIIEETTYGTSSKENTTKVFRKNLLESIKNGETFIAPVFSLGRSQEILLELRRMQDENILDKSIPIYLDGRLAQNYTNFYLNHKEYLMNDTQDFLPANYKEVQGFDERQLLGVDRNCKIILTTSGMGSYGPAQFYLPNYLSSPKCTIHFCGYTTPNTFGSKIKEIPDGQFANINGIMTKKKAKILSTSEFSGHAKKEDLLDLLKQFPNLKSVLLNHGEEEAKEKYANEVINELNPKKIAILGSKFYIRVGAYGVIKSHPTSDMNFDFAD